MAREPDLPSRTLWSVRQHQTCTTYVHITIIMPGRGQRVAQELFRGQKSCLVLEWWGGENIIKWRTLILTHLPQHIWLVISTPKSSNGPNPFIFQGPPPTPTLLPVPCTEMWLEWMMFQKAVTAQEPSHWQSMSDLLEEMCANISFLEGEEIGEQCQLNAGPHFPTELVGGFFLQFCSQSQRLNVENWHLIPSSIAFSFAIKIQTSSLLTQLRVHAWMAMDPGMWNLQRMDFYLWPLTC